MTLIAALDGSKLDNDFVMRIIKCPSFNSDTIDSTILHNKLFVNKPEVSDILNEKGIKAYLKIDAGQYDNGTMINPDFQDMALKLSTYDVIGTKARSIVHNVFDIPMLIKQQLTWASLVYKANKIPIVELEILNDAENKGELEMQLTHCLYLMVQDFKGQLILKLSLPTSNNAYEDLLDLDQVTRIVALSGGKSRQVACRLLSTMRGADASFSRALIEDLNNDMSDDILNIGLGNNIAEILTASNKNKYVHSE